MSREAFEQGDWQAVVDGHALESHEPADWLHYGVALLQTLTPGAEAGKQQQQAALAFVQAQKEGATAEAVEAAQWQAVLHNLKTALAAIELPEAAKQARRQADRQHSRLARKLRHHQKPLIRTVHHLACTGGTVISKCLASMPRVALMSEVNSLNRFGNNFEPTNPLLLLERSYRQLTVDEIKEDFLGRIAQAVKICQKDNMNIVIRDHSHTDFCMGGTPAAITPICDFLAKDYDILSVVTVRHPLDSYLGLLAQGWHTQFSPSTLEEYCYRYMSFLNRYSNIALCRYEDFTADPQHFMRDLCWVLELEYSPTFLDRFGAIKLSGDSGRGSNSKIGPRERRPIPEPVMMEISTSQSYLKLLATMGYSS